MGQLLPNTLLLNFINPHIVKKAVDPGFQEHFKLDEKEDVPSMAEFDYYNREDNLTEVRNIDHLLADKIAHCYQMALDTEVGE